MCLKTLLIIVAYVAFVKSTDTTTDGTPETTTVADLDAGFPYQVSVQYKDTHVCGGAILNTRWILSSAGCILSYKNKRLQILAGTNDLDKGGVRRHVLLNINVGFYRPLARNDLILLRVLEPLPKDNPAIKPVVLPSNYTPEDTACIVSGWGTDQSGQNSQTILKSHLTTTISNELCQQLLPSTPIRYGNVCALTKTGESFCNGDRGAPLVDAKTYTDGKPVLIGIAYEIPCALGSPDLYTRVSPYVTTIKTLIGF